MQSVYLHNTLVIESGRSVTIKRWGVSWEGRHVAVRGLVKLQVLALQFAIDTSQHHIIDLSITNHHVHSFRIMINKSTTYSLVNS